jgi:hypothetical protein
MPPAAVLTAAVSVTVELLKVALKIPEAGDFGENPFGVPVFPLLRGEPDLRGLRENVLFGETGKEFFGDTPLALGIKGKGPKKVEVLCTAGGVRADTGVVRSLEKEERMEDIRMDGGRSFWGISMDGALG